MFKLQSFLEQNKHRSVSEDKYLIRVRHVLMITYGWIPLKDYMEMNIQEINDLLGEIEWDRKQEEAAMKKIKK